MHGAYDSTRDGSPSLNGNGDGVAAGKPCAGCVGKADNKNPQGQEPQGLAGADHNAGYECDRNSGIGQTNPAHTGCVQSSVTPPEQPPKVTPPEQPPKVTPPEQPPKVTPPEQPPTVTPEQPPTVTPPQQPPTVTPQQPPTVTPQQPPTVTPQQPPEVLAEQQQSPPPAAVPTEVLAQTVEKPAAAPAAAPAQQAAQLAKTGSPAWLEVGLGLVLVLVGLIAMVLAGASRRPVRTS